jgi:hypothetical protein
MGVGCSPLYTSISVGMALIWFYDPRVKSVTSLCLCILNGHLIYVKVAKMNEADRIRRELLLKGAMMEQSDPNQPVPMAGYPNRPGAYSPSQLYQTLLKSGIPKEEARQKTFNMMQENNAAINEELPDQTEKLFPMEGEF